MVPLNTTASPPLTLCNLPDFKPTVNRSGFTVKHIIDLVENDDDSHKPKLDDKNDVSLHINDVNMSATHVLKQAELMNYIMCKLNKDQFNIMYGNISSTEQAMPTVLEIEKQW